MAGLYKRGKTFWVIYRIGGKLVRKSLETTNERVAKSKFKQLEYEIALGDLQIASEDPVGCKYSSTLNLLFFQKLIV